MTLGEDIIEQIKQNESVFLRITPKGKLRMVSSDKWYKKNLKHHDPKKRARAEKVKAHWDWCTAVQWLAKKEGYEIGEKIAVEFRMPFPESYYPKKRRDLTGQPHKVKPDADNMLKGLIDALAKQDSNIWLKISWKVWTDGPGAIVIYKI